MLTIASATTPSSKIFRAAKHRAVADINLANKRWSGIVSIPIPTSRLSRYCSPSLGTLLSVLIDDAGGQLMQNLYEAIPVPRLCTCHLCGARSYSLAEIPDAIYLGAPKDSHRLSGSL